MLILLYHHRPSFHRLCRQPEDSVCPSAGGIRGIESPDEFKEDGRACCLVECEGCGGVGCSLLTGEATECCISDITETGRECSDVGEAPCFIATGKEKAHIALVLQPLSSAVLIRGIAEHEICIYPTIVESKTHMAYLLPALILSRCGGRQMNPR